MGQFSNFLFARPSFAEGMGRVLDLGGTLNEYNVSDNGAQADLRAMYADWAALAEDLRKAGAQFDGEPAARR